MNRTNWVITSGTFNEIDTYEGGGLFSGKTLSNINREKKYNNLNEESIIESITIYGKRDNTFEIVIELYNGTIRVLEEDQQIKEKYNVFLENYKDLRIKLNVALDFWQKECGRIRKTIFDIDDIDSIVGTIDEFEKIYPESIRDDIITTFKNLGTYIPKPVKNIGGNESVNKNNIDIIKNINNISNKISRLEETVKRIENMLTSLINNEDITVTI